jgi:hypothetical protein
VVPCVVICLFLPSTHHHHLLPFGVVVGSSRSLYHGEIIPCPIVLCRSWNSFAIEKNGIFLHMLANFFKHLHMLVKEIEGKFE